MLTQPTFVKRKITLLSIALTLCLSSCGIGLIIRGVSKKHLTVEREAIPPDFPGNDGTLLIMLWGTKSFDKYEIKAFDKFYHGKKKYIGFGDLKKDEFQDVEKYRFIFSQGPGDSAMYTSNSYSYSNTSRVYHIWDRQTGEFYNGHIKSSFFYRILQAYAKNMEKYRTNQPVKSKKPRKS